MGNGRLASATVHISHDSLFVLAISRPCSKEVTYGFRHRVLIRKPGLPRVLMLVLVMLVVSSR